MGPTSKPVKLLELPRFTATAMLVVHVVSLRLAAQLPPADAARHLREYQEVGLRRAGDVARGRELFFAEARLGCSKCHSVDGTSSRAGPDLLAVGDKFPRGELIREVLEPSASLAVGYATTTVVMKSGEELQGVIKASTAESVELIGADGKRVSLKVGDIREQRSSGVSLMPDGWHTLMSREEFSDLIEYLTTLRQAANALASHRGMPEEIPALATPVGLHALLTEDLRFPPGVAPKPGDIRSGLVWFGQVPGWERVFLAVHQTGRIWRLAIEEAGDLKTLFADLSAEVFNERGPNGLLGLAFHPRFRENRKYYVKQQVFEEGKIVTAVFERRASEDLQKDSGMPPRRVWQVIGTTQDHTGGCLGFGPDGYLYIAMGDTGPQQDPQGHGQDLTTDLGKIVRLDVDREDGDRPYGIPQDNPYRDRPDARAEIWASGFREPWRFSFDTLTGDLWVGDVGQDRVEEVAIVRRGENHGWNVIEGFEPFSNRYRKEGVSYVSPVFAYRRKFGNSVTGGYVYRGDKASSFYGVYVCGDFTSRRIWGIKQENRQLQVVRQIGMAPQSIASFAQDEQGRIYVVGYEGMVYLLDFAGTSFEVPAGKSGR